MKIFLVAFAVVARLVPHPWNLTPVGAFGLFAGTKMTLRQAWLVPVVALLVSDLITGFYSLTVMAGVYLGFAAAPFIGRLLIRDDENPAHILGAVGVNAVVFFLVSNFAVWAAGYYPPTSEGLLACYVAGLPFMGISALGDSFYCALLFGGQAAFRRMYPGIELDGKRL